MSVLLKKYQSLLLVLLCYITVFAFYPSIKANFTCVDDSAMVTANPYITSLSAENFKKAFTSYHYRLYHPVVTLSYMIEYHLFQKDPYIYHLDNLLLHLFNVLLVFFIFKKLTKSFIIAYITSLLFAIHPTRVETVFWISSRKDTLYSLFYLLSVLLYINIYDTKHRKLFFFLSLISFILSCMSKPMAVTLPVILVLIDYYNDKFNIKKTLKYIPFILVSFVFCVITVHGYYDDVQKEISSSYVRAIDILDAHYNFLFYLKELFFSISSLLHPQFYNHSQLPPCNVLYSPVLIWLILFFVVYSLKFTKKIFFGLSFFLVVLLPSSGVMQTGMAPVADRYVYLAYIGFFYIFAEVVLIVYKNFQTKKTLLILFFSLIGCVLFYLTFNRSILWMDNVKLVLATIENFPNTASHAYLALGTNYVDVQKYEEAMEYYKKSYDIDNHTIYIYFALGYLYQLLGDNEKALKYYKQIENKFIPVYNSMINNVAVIKNNEGKTDEAIELIEKILKNGEVFEDYIFRSLAVFYFEKKDYDKVIEALKEALKRNPLERYYYLFLFNVYKKQNKFKEIEVLLDKFIKNKINDYIFFNSVGIMYFERENYTRAKEIFSLSIEQNTKNHVAYFFLGNICAIKEQYMSAIICYTLAILNCDKKISGEYFFKRAVAWFYINKYDLALKDMNNATKHNFNVPNDFKMDLDKKIKGVIK